MECSAPLPHVLIRALSSDSEVVSERGMGCMGASIDLEPKQKTSTPKETAVLFQWVLLQLERSRVSFQESENGGI